MTIPEKQAVDFFKNSIEGQYIHDHEYGRLITNVLFRFKRQRDKYDFLIMLLKQIEVDLAEHKAECTKGDCGYDQKYDIWIFNIKQEIEIVADQIKEEKLTDAFTADEIYALHNKINEIIESLKDLKNDNEQMKAGGDVLSQQLEDLKERIAYGKGIFESSVYGSMAKAFQSGVEGSIVAKVFEQFTGPIKEVTKLLDKF